MKQNRLKSKVTWISALSLIFIIFNSLGLFEKIGIDEKNVMIISESILSLLVLFGILNNPTDENNF